MSRMGVSASGRSSAVCILAVALAVAILLSAGRPAVADFHDGLTAFEAQDYATALEELRPLARQGDARAQRLLGILYRDGLAVPQDFVQAHMWLNLAAAAGEPRSAGERDDLVGRMTAEQVAEAQRLAAAWQPEKATADAPPASMQQQAIDAPAAQPNTPMTEAQITDLQWQLAVHGYDPGPADGRVGARTRAAIELYQTDAGLPVDGAPSLALLDHLQFSNPPVRNQRPPATIAAAPTRAPEPAAAGAWTPPTEVPAAQPAATSGLMQIYTLTVQQTLAAKGYRPGPADGVAGARTRAAIRKYQQDYRLPVTGEVSLELVNHLRLISGTPLPPQG